MPILAWNARTRDFAIESRENVDALRTTTERLANARSAPTIALDVEFACRRRTSHPKRARRTTRLGMPINTWGANATLDIVDRIALKRNAHRETIFLAEREPPRDAIALGAANAIIYLVSARASRDTLEIDASTKRF